MAAATLDTVTKQLEDDNAIIFRKMNRVDAKQDEAIKIQTFQLKTLTAMLNLQLDDSAAARERAREASRLGEAEPAGVPDAKAEEAKAGGFFSKMGKAVMNPIGAMGKGMKSIGKGIEGFLKGLARGLAAFANPMVVLGVAAIAISLPIFAAGLAAAFKVFEMIAGEGKAMEMITGIIESLGEAIGTILHKVLSGFGEMVKRMGPFIEAFFDGLAVVIKALHPIIVDVFKVIKSIITDPVLNKTIQKVLDTIQVAIKSVEKILIAFAPVIESVLTKVGVIIIAVADKIEKIVATIGSVIEKILGSFDNVVNQIKPIIEQIGKTIETIINAIGDNIAKIGKSIEGVFTSIGTAVTKVIGGIEALIKTIGDTIVKVIDGIVTGIERLSGLDAGNMAKVAVGLGLLAVGLAAFSVGAAIGGATMPSKETLEGIAKSVERFGAIASENLAPVGKGMLAIGAGLAVFGVGAKVAGATMPTDKELESIAESVERFGKIPSEKLAPVGVGMQEIGDGLTKFGVGSFVASLLSDPTKLVSVADSVAKFGTIDATNFAKVGTGIQAIGSGLTKFGVGGFLSSLAEGFGKWVGATDPVEKFQKFATIGPGLNVTAEGIKTLAGALKFFEKSVKTLDLDKVDVVAGALEKIKDAADPGAMAKLGNLAGTLNPFSGSAATGGQSIPALITETNRLLKTGLFGSGALLAELQTETNDLGGKAASATVVVTNNSSQQINQSKAMVLPPSPIVAGNGQSTLDT
jgi:hypothetical protein